MIREGMMELEKSPFYNHSKRFKQESSVDLKLLDESLMGNRIFSVSRVSPNRLHNKGKNLIVEKADRHL